MKVWLSLLITGVVLTGTATVAATREVIPFNTGWTFNYVFDHNKNLADQPITIPHTWNAKEVMQKASYQRTSGVYRNELFAPASWANKRVFLYFEGVNSVADVFINKKYAGQHKGGYTSFVFELTGLLKYEEKNLITVMAGNTYRLDVLPLNGDFNIFGGIHRPVSLLITEKNCISPLDHGAPGVYISQQLVTKEQAVLKIKTVLSLQKKGNYQVKISFYDSASQLLLEKFSGVSGPSNDQTIIIKNPHLWQGKEDPYLYRMDITLLDNGKEIDKLTQQTGLRYFSADPGKGFFLNGKPYDLHGVGYHEDTYGKGSAYRKEDYDTDIKLFNEIGLTAVRLTHYPHGKPIYDLCDKNGIILWTEIPLIGFGGHVGGGYVNNKELHQHIKEMLEEMIKQNYNHPSIICWGLMNELKTDFDDPAPFIRELHTLAKKLDPTRYTVIADFLDATPFEKIPDLISWNKYYGWYGGTVNDIGSWLDARHQSLPNTPIGISEYGAGGSMKHHSDKLLQPRPDSSYHPEEWQTYFHENYWRQFKQRPYLWSKFIWVFADFSSNIRAEGDTIGINDKGLVTYDKKQKKDAFYFYKANWSKEPVVYIAEKRFINRTNAVSYIKVYSNCDIVACTFNGKPLTPVKPDELGMVIWKNITLQPGINTIEVTASKGETVYKDAAAWNLVKE